MGSIFVFLTGVLCSILFMHSDNPLLKYYINKVLDTKKERVYDHHRSRYVNNDYVYDGYSGFDNNPKNKGSTGIDNLYYSANTVYQHAIDGARMLFHETKYEFLLVSDLDLNSQVAPTTWRSYMQKGTLRRNPYGNFTVSWGECVNLESHSATKNRAMELSELVRFNHLLLAACDITGLIYKVRLNNDYMAAYKKGISKEASSKEKAFVFQRYAIADGDGDFPKPFKTEWATVKDGLLCSTGKEWTTEDGSIVHHNPQWVKTISTNGHIENYNWRPVYEALRTATGTSHPGYLWHEAVHWDARERVWLFLPRKASKCVARYENPKDDLKIVDGERDDVNPHAHCSHYSPLHDETNGTNILLVASEDFSKITVHHVGPVQPKYGFSALRKIPGTSQIYAAIKVKEVTEKTGSIGNGIATESFLTVFDIEGNSLLDGDIDDDGNVVDLGVGRWTRIPGNFKFEGLEFHPH